MKLIVKNKPILSAFILMALGFIAGFHPAQAVPLRTPETLSLTVKNTDITELFEMLSRQRKVNVLLSPGVEGKVSVNLYDVSLDNAIDSIAAAGGYVVQRTGDTYLVSKRDEAGKDFAGGVTQLRTFKVQYSDLEEVTKILEKHLSRYGKITSLKQRKLLIVEERADFMTRIENLLVQLDRQPVQILIEAKILEISLDDNQSFGFDWSKTFSQGEGSFGLQGLAAATGSPGFFFNLMNKSIEVSLDALTSKGRVRTLSTPKLLALEHQEAQVIIGDKTGYRVTTTINQVTQESIQFIDSGVILNVTPFVDRAGRIKMDIHPEVSSVRLLDGVPSLSTTEVNTQLLAEDGQTIFIGGLMKNSSSKRRTGVPLLSDIPLLGRLFSNSEETGLNTETIVLIRPHIIRTPRDLLVTGDAKYVDRVDSKLKNEAIRIDRLLNRN